MHVRSWYELKELVAAKVAFGVLATFTFADGVQHIVGMVPLVESGARQCKFVSFCY